MKKVRIEQIYPAKNLYALTMHARMEMSSKFVLNKPIWQSIVSNLDDALYDAGHELKIRINNNLLYS